MKPTLTNEDWEALLAQVSSNGEMPVIITSPGLRQRSFPYAKAVPFSLLDLMSVFNRCRQYNPVDSLLTASTTGPGTMTVGLPGAPGAATGNDRSALLPGYFLDVVKNRNVNAQPFSFSGTGRHEDGSVYTLPSVDIEFTQDASDNERILVLGAENTQRGPMLRTIRCTTNDYPSQFLGNGAAAMAAGEQLSVTIASGGANVGYNLVAITSQQETYDTLKQLLGWRLHPEAPRINSGHASLDELIPPSIVRRLTSPIKLGK